MNYRKKARLRGFTMIEMIVALGILGATFVGIMVFMDAICKGLYSESIEADQQTRMASHMFEMISEIRQATPQSLGPTVSTFGPLGASTITFKLPVATDPKTGLITWGNTITYRLAANAGKFIDAANTIQEASIMRDEVSATGTTTTVIEGHVPFTVPAELIDNAAATAISNTAGFNVWVWNNTVTITIHKTGDTRVNLGTGAPPTPTASNNGTLATSIYTGTYYLRNPGSAVAPSSPN